MAYYCYVEETLMDVYASALSLRRYALIQSYPFVYVTAHEKVPETKKGDDGVLLLRRGPDEVYGALSCGPPINCALIFVAKSDNNRVA